jgi:hypothetical protein
MRRTIVQGCLILIAGAALSLGYCWVCFGTLGGDMWILNILLSSVVSLAFSTPLLIALLVDSLWFTLPPVKGWPVTSISIAVYAVLLLFCVFAIVSPEAWDRNGLIFVSLICASAATSRLVPSLIARRLGTKK